MLRLLQKLRLFQHYKASSARGFRQEVANTERSRRSERVFPLTTAQE
jgi:hypothetical protein